MTPQDREHARSNEVEAESNPPPPSTGEPSLQIDGWRVLAADDEFVVVEKSSGLLSVPGLGPQNADCLIARVCRRFPTARIVHRLDQHTSGVLVLALDAASHRALSRQFELREVGKRYIAVVGGVMVADEGVIDIPIRKDMERKSRQLVDWEQGKPSRTRWSVLERGGDRTTIALVPETGRSHQLRLHLATIGHPILGDSIYAPPELVAAAPRLMLHAEMLEFTHPRTGARVVFRAAIGWNTP